MSPLLKRIQEAAVLYAGAIWLAFACEASGETNAFERGCAAFEARQFAGAAASTADRPDLGQVARVL